MIRSSNYKRWKNDCRMTHVDGTEYVYDSYLIYMTLYRRATLLWAAVAKYLQEKAIFIS